MVIGLFQKSTIRLRTLLSFETLKAKYNVYGIQYTLLAYIKIWYRKNMPPPSIGKTTQFRANQDHLKFSW